MAVFSFYISSRANPVHDGKAEWQAFLPHDRHMETSVDGENMSITCGRYFEAAERLLGENGCEVVRAALGAGFDRQVAVEEIDGIAVILIKHGAFYHPAKVEVTLKTGNVFPFVLNVAVSENGARLIAEEYTHLNSLDLLFGYPFVPRPYFLRGVEMSEDRELPMFLAQWCEGHHEFHWSAQGDDRRLAVKVWDDDNGHFFLDDDQTVTLFGQAAMILTSYYNFSSSYNISMWHHAAGDFVVGVKDKNVSVKLISVRQYVPLMELDNPDMWTLMETLFVYFISLSIRMRLDRLDGVGETVWGGEAAAMGTVEGFLMGLQHQVANELIALELFDGTKMYLKTFSKKNLLDWCTQVAEKIYAQSPDLDLIRSNLDAHAGQLHHYLCHYLAE